MKTTAKLRNWLEKQTRDLGAGARLPTDKKLSSQFGLSVRTVARILTEFKARGLVERIAGKGTFIPQQEDNVEDAVSPHVSSAESLAYALRDSIRDGTLQIGKPLPTVKYLSLQYRMSEHTVSKAFSILIEEGLACRIGRAVWTGTFHTRMRQRHSPRDTFFFVDDHCDCSSIFTTAPFGYAFQHMEQELQNYGYRLHYEHIDALDSLTQSWIRKRRVPNGLVFWNSSHETLDSIRSSLVRLMRVQDGRSPAVLMDWNAGGFPKNLPRDIWVVSRGNVRTSIYRTLARYLAGIHAKTVVLILDGKQSNEAIIREFHSFQKLVTEMHEQYSAITVVTALLSPEGRRNYTRFFNKIRKATEHFYQTYLKDKYHVERGGTTLGTLLAVRSLQELNRTIRGPQVWVFLSESTAAAACRLGKVPGVEIPRDLSIIGLENNPAYYHLGITTCSFVSQQVGYLMAHTIIGDIPLQRTTRGYLRIPIHLIQKRTSGQQTSQHNKQRSRSS